MARRHKHEEHANHEAWAIPYGDLITLLLAFFVVMYAMSSVNEGKYRVLSDSLVAAFNGAPKTMEPIQVGEKQAGPGKQRRPRPGPQLLQSNCRQSSAFFTNPRLGQWNWNRKLKWALLIRHS